MLFDFLDRIIGLDRIARLFRCRRLLCFPSGYSFFRRHRVTSSAPALPRAQTNRIAGRRRGFPIRRLADRRGSNSREAARTPYWRPPWPATAPRPLPRLGRVEMVEARTAHRRWGVG